MRRSAIRFLIWIGVAASRQSAANFFFPKQRLSAEEPLRLFFNLRLSSESGYAAGMKPAPLTPQPEWHHLPRLAPEFYRGFAV